ncbi:hypothetical protein [Geminisphaera colitermitum]|uniref:hypothetical protein n=1 Tax=Geminisphaera colitermitum TaxID=1148786 RepID=UPI0012FEF55A|nr:hypothetical protein [Geminisphaera colitermitum]
MIPPPFKYRFEGDSGVDIATQKIDAVFPDGERRRVVLRLGAPFIRDNVFGIRSELENLDRTDGPLAGSESFDALINGIAWIHGRLRVFAEKHRCTYYWPDSNDIFDYSDYFNLT